MGTRLSREGGRGNKVTAGISDFFQPNLVGQLLFRQTKVDGNIQRGAGLS